MGLIRSIRRLTRDERGVAAIEFAMIAPIFIAMILSVIDIGRYMWTLNTMQYAIDEAVRAGIIQELPEEEIEALAKSSLAGLDTGAITVDAVSGASSLVINADTTFAFLFPISSFMATTTISLRTEMPN